MYTHIQRCANVQEHMVSATRVNWSGA